MDDFSLQKISYKVFACYDTENFSKAKRILKVALEKNPEGYWLISNLAICNYETGKFKLALEISNKAYAIAPNDPMVLNYHASILKVNDFYKEAIEIWLKIINTSEENLANSRFGEGIKWAKSLKVDTLFNLGNAYYLMDDYKTAAKYYQEHLNSRKRGLYSLYSKAEVQAELDDAIWQMS